MVGKQKNKSVDGLSKKETPPAEEFFEEEAERPRFFGYWVLMATILLLLFIVVVYLAVYSKRAANFGDEKADEEISENLLPFSDRVKDVKGSGRATMIFRGKEFAKATGALESDFPLSGATFVITKDSLNLIGRIKDSVIFWPLTFRTSCEVKDQKFSCLLPTDNFANLVISGGNKEKIEKTFDQNLNQPLAANNMIADEMQTADGYIELRVIKELR